MAEQYIKLGWHEEAKRLLLMRQSEPESEADRQLLQVLEAGELTKNIHDDPLPLTRTPMGGRDVTST